MFLTGSNGPNKRKAILTAELEFAKLADDPILFPLFSELCKGLNRPELIEYAHHVSKYSPKELEEIVLAKVLTVPEKGNKHRAVGLLANPFQQILDTINMGLENVLDKFVKTQNCA
jgi:hypothetical protein